MDFVESNPELDYSMFGGHMQDRWICIRAESSER